MSKLQKTRKDTDVDDMIISTEAGKGNKKRSIPHLTVSPVLAKDGRITGISTERDILHIVEQFFISTNKHASEDRAVIKSLESLMLTACIDYLWQTAGEEGLTINTVIDFVNLIGSTSESDGAEYSTPFDFMMQDLEHEGIALNVVRTANAFKGVSYRDKQEAKAMLVQRALWFILDNTGKPPAKDDPVESDIFHALIKVFRPDILKETTETCEEI